MVRESSSAMALLTAQRDRFVAFAFAGAELFLEVDEEGRIGFAAGGSRAMIGCEPESLTGRVLMELAVPADRFLVGEHLVRLQQSSRAADMIVALEQGEGRSLPALVSGMKSPQRQGVFHITLRHLPLVARGADREVLVSPVAIKEFVASTTEMGRQAAWVEARPKLALYDIDLETVRTEKGQAAAKQVEANLVQSLRAWASGSSVVGRAAGGRYSVLLDEHADQALLAERLGDVTEGSGLRSAVRSTVLDLSGMLEEESLSIMLDRALRHFADEGVEGMAKKSLRDFAPPPKGLGGAGVLMPKPGRGRT